MRHLSLVLPVVAAVGCFGVRDVEAENGWADVRLGISPAELGGELLRDEGTGDTLYRRASEPERFGRAPVGGIRYHFYDDQLWRIEVKTGSSKDFLPELTRLYGTPPFDRPWHWEGATVLMRFQGTEYDSSATLTVTKKPIAERRDRERPARLEAARRRAAEAAASAPDPAASPASDAAVTDAPGGPPPAGVAPPGP